MHGALSASRLTLMLPWSVAMVTSSGASVSGSPGGGSTCLAAALRVGALRVLGPRCRRLVAAARGEREEREQDEQEQAAQGSHAGDGSRVTQRGAAGRPARGRRGSPGSRRRAAPPRVPAPRRRPGGRGRARPARWRSGGEPGLEGVPLLLARLLYDDRGEPVLDGELDQLGERDELVVPAGEGARPPGWGSGTRCRRRTRPGRRVGRGHGSRRARRRSPAAGPPRLGTPHVAGADGDERVDLVRTGDGAVAGEECVRSSRPRSRAAAWPRRATARRGRRRRRGPGARRRRRGG